MTSAPEPARSLRKLATGPLPTVVTLAVALAFLLFLVVRADIDVAERWRSITNSRPIPYGLGLAVYYFAVFVRGYRWRIMLRNAQLRSGEGTSVPSLLACAQFVLLGWSGNLVTWLRLGNAYRAHLAAEAMGGSFFQALGTILAERILDVLAVLALLAGAALLALAQGNFHPFRDPLLISLALAAFGGTALGLMRRFGPALAQALPGLLAGPYNRLQHGVLHGFGHFPKLAILSLVGLLCEAGRLLLVAHSLGIALAVPLAVLASMAGAVLAGVPLTPGGVGLVETGLTGLLLLQLNGGQAVEVVVLDRSITYVSVILFGGLLFVGREAAKRRWPR